MLKRQKTSLINRFLFNQITLAVLGLFIIVAISFPLAKNVSKQYKINKEIRELEKEISDMESKNLKLTKLIEFLESEQFVQEQARMNLSYKKEGEEVVVVQYKGGQAGAADEVSGLADDQTVYNIHGAGKEDARKEIHNPGRWSGYFFE